MGSRRVCATTTAPASVVWATLADFGEIAAWARPVDHSRMLTDGIGLGAVRRVQVGRQTLRETVLEWDPPSLLSYRVTGLPPRLGDVTLRWDVAAAPDGRTTVSVTAQLRPSVPKPVASVVLRGLERTARQLLDSLVTAVEKQPEAVA